MPQPTVCSELISGPAFEQPLMTLGDRVEILLGVPWPSSGTLKKIDYGRCDQHHHNAPRSHFVEFDTRSVQGFYGAWFNPADLRGVHHG